MNSDVTFQPLPQPDQSLPAAVAVTPTGSPFVFTAATNGALISRLGTVSLIEYGRLGVYSTVGLLSGMLEMNKNDTIRVTYAVAPTMTFIPR